MRHPYQSSSTTDVTLPRYPIMESSYSIIAIMDPAESTDLQPFSITAVMAFASVTSAASTG